MPYKERGRQVLPVMSTDVQACIQTIISRSYISTSCPQKLFLNVPAPSECKNIFGGSLENLKGLTKVMDVYSQ